MQVDGVDQAAAREGGISLHVSEDMAAQIINMQDILEQARRIQLFFPLKGVPVHAWPMVVNYHCFSALVGCR